jgi:hypothetical protein
MSLHNSGGYFDFKGKLLEENNSSGKMDRPDG